MSLLNGNIIKKLISIILIVFLYYLIISIVDIPSLPTIKAVASEFLRLIRNPSILIDIKHTLLRIFISLAITLTISLLLAILINTNQLFKQLSKLPLVLAFTIPGIITAMICLIIFGISNISAILAASINLIPLITMVLSNGIENMDYQLIQVAKVYKIPLIRYLRVFLIPHLLPYLITSVRSGFSITWKIVIIAEVFGLGNGIGYRVNIAYQLYQVDKIFALITLFTLVTLTIDQVIFEPVEKHLIRWKSNQDENLVLAI